MESYHRSTDSLLPQEVPTQRLSIGAWMFAQTVAINLEVLDGVPSLPDDQAHFAGWYEDLLDSTGALQLTVEAGSVPTALHNLAQQPLCMSGG